MQKKLTYSILFFLFISWGISQPSKKETSLVKPKLIVGIVVDQMRNDYIYRFWDRYGNGGFKRLVNNGYYLKNANYNYVPTYTGPGHASIYTGTTPRTHGIIANEWYDKKLNKEVYCVDDESVKSIGTLSKNGKRSPVNLISSTFGDELKMSTNGKAKVFGIALKDRSSILPAGHSADAAFWYDDSTGNFVSSTWYLNELPKWLSDFNSQQLPKKLLQNGWKTLKPIETYSNSLADNNAFEKAPNKKETPTFPYDYSNFIEKNNLGILKATPFGNTITKDLALSCLRNEKLGKDEFTDLLAISFSSPDIIAHSYGPRSIEMEDVYMRLDLDIEEILKTLDTEVGANNYVVFLTADHGGADVPQHLIKEQISADYFNTSLMVKNLKQFLQNSFSDSALYLNCSNEQIFLNEEKMMKLNRQEIEQKICDYLITHNGIAEAYPSTVLKNGGFQFRDVRTLIQNGFNHQKSGNIAFTLKPGWMDYPKTGTTHGASYSYDTHVPLIFYGAGIEKGASFNYYKITQIAPTISDIIQINYPNGCTDESIDKILKKEK